MHPGTRRSGWGTHRSYAGRGGVTRAGAGGVRGVTGDRIETGPQWSRRVQDTLASCAVRLRHVLMGALPHSAPHDENGHHAHSQLPAAVPRRHRPARRHRPRPRPRRPAADRTARRPRRRPDPRCAGRSRPRRTAAGHRDRTGHRRGRRVRVPRAHQHLDRAGRRRRRGRPLAELHLRRQRRHGARRPAHPRGDGRDRPRRLARAVAELRGEGPGLLRPHRGGVPHPLGRRRGRPRRARDRPARHGQRRRPRRAGARPRRRRGLPELLLRRLRRPGPQCPLRTPRRRFALRDPVREHCRPHPGRRRPLPAHARRARATGEPAEPEEPSEPVDPPAAPPADSLVGHLQITELVPDSTNVDGADGYEFIELYNATTAPISMADYEPRYLYTADGESITNAADWPLSPSDAVIEPGGTLVIWVRNGSNDAATAEDFAANYGADPASLHLVETPTAGMANGSGRGLEIRTRAGDSVHRAFYNLSGADDTQPDQGIQYRTGDGAEGARPTSPVRRRRASPRPPPARSTPPRCRPSSSRSPPIRRPPRSETSAPRSWTRRPMP
ncbi:lamin tail domain-containing protein [Brachybacterium sp. GPGPB12]|uniref:lamin tail domain-containing protein n=1 Tax=Brachybacterium sp. GPGPB12 TaxID=3023517 RepID=UPI0031343D75